MCWLWNTVDFNYMHLWCNYYIFMSIHVHIYRKQCAVTLIQLLQRSKNRLGAETFSALLQMHRSWNALPDHNRVHCARFNPLTWVRKKYAPHTHCKRSNVNLPLCVCAAFFIRFLIKKYELYSIIIFTRAGQRLRLCHCMLCQTSHGRRVISLRSFFWDRPF